jgi:NAD(P)-dependent dehydrogenase (short-subunit alcohol dehydrogenase family)
MVDKVAIVTGAGRGIGAAIAMKLAKDLGMNIVVVDIDEATASETAESIKALGNEAIAIKCDVSSAEDVESMVQQAFDFGEVEVVVNNAGITRDAMLLKMEEKDWDLVMNINIKSMFLIVKNCCSRWVATAKAILAPQREPLEADMQAAEAALAEAEANGDEAAAEEQKALMAEIKAKISAVEAVPPSTFQKRRIINISSMVAKGGNIGQANYTAAKAGVIAFTKTVAKEMAKYNITSNAIQPGFIKTPMTDKMPEKVINKFVLEIPAGRMGLPEDIAGAVKFLASPDADYITGISIEVAGGMNM